ncbi:hypothetical protein [Bacillus sp. FJAT-45350]|uniref:hypothetical protein n=1 Tax=Bacillus sp. FJAT-45350 TaxID=2011014 RepID=UPI000BB6BB71|nr:hypothetical protein [Bacillus sp. FJAT-45350]
MNQRLIESIVKEVLVSLEADTVKSKPKLLYISSKKTKDLEMQLDFLRAHWDVIDSKNIDFYTKPLINEAVFLNIDQDTLVRIALGFTDSAESKLFSQLIYYEIPITFVVCSLLENYLNINVRKHKYRQYIKSIQAYRNTLEGYGVLFKPLEEVIPFEQEVSFEKKNCKGTKPLIVQEDIRNFTGKQIVVKPGTIITPLAKDAARELGIEISFL